MDKLREECFLFVLFVRGCAPVHSLLAGAWSGIRLVCAASRAGVSPASGGVGGFNLSFATGGGGATSCASAACTVLGFDSDSGISAKKALAESKSLKILGIP